MHAKTESMLFQEDTDNFPRFSTPSSSAVSPVVRKNIGTPLALSVD
jgi:hypothetical protein